MRAEQTDGLRGGGMAAERGLNAVEIWPRARAAYGNKLVPAPAPVRMLAFAVSGVSSV